MLGHDEQDIDSVAKGLFLMRLCADGSATGFKQWGLGEDDWMGGIAQTADGDILLAGHALRDADRGGATRAYNAVLMTFAAE